MLVPRLGTPVTVFGDFTTTEATVLFYRKHGFALCPDLVTEAELVEAEALVAEVLESDGPREDGMLFDYAAPGGDCSDPAVLQLLLPFDYAPRLFETALFKNAASVARSLLGPAVVYRGSHYMEKPGPRDNPTAAHQDEAFWDPAALHEAVSLWFPLQDTTEENGCLRFVPGGHENDIIHPHQHLNRDPRVHALEVCPGTFDDSEFVALPVSRGSASVHHCRVLHDAGPNGSSKQRRALIVNFASNSKALSTPRVFRWQRTETDAATLRDARKIVLP
jgi:hypothetical protein